MKKGPDVSTWVFHESGTRMRADGALYESLKRPCERLKSAYGAERALMEPQHGA
jgi:hypothetical protein